MGERILAIGDIHGCLAQFDALLSAVELRPEDHLILLGDYVDRGPDSAGVLRRIIDLTQSHKVTALRGNHEELMLLARRGPESLDIWRYFGGQTALNSYRNGGTLHDVPHEHWEFLEKKTVSYLETTTHIFVHAGADPHFDMHQQSPNVLQWRTCHSMTRHKSGRIVVCGHTVQDTTRPLNKGFLICLDTGASFGGPLTCLDVESGDVWQADENGAVSRSQISDYGE